MVNKVNLRSNNMCRRPAACDECTKNCVIVHDKKNCSSSVVNRFFKVMHGKNYSQVLYLPPKFARTVKDLVGQQVEIEDSDEETWPVTFSNVNGSLALKEGWHEFFRNHNLEIGDMLVFNYMKKGHFIVQIFDKSACQMLGFSPRSPQNNKRCKPNPITIEDDSSRSVENNNSDDEIVIENGHSNVMENVGNSLLQPTFINLEEDLICMVNNRDGCYPEEDRNFLHDLSNFEMKKTRSDSNEFQKSLEGAITPPFVDTEMIDGCFTEKPSDNAKQAAAVKKEIVESREKVMTSAEQSFAIKKELVESREKDKTSTDASLVAITSSQLLSSMLHIAPAKQVASVKKELMESREDVYRFPQPYRGNLPTMGMKFGQTSSTAVKIEPDLSYDTVPSVATTSFSAQVKSLSYLELPVCIPWSVQQKREMGQGRVVFLRDPSRKLWPVLHPDLFYVRAFTGNWRSFCEANHVKPGDVCEFQPESHASSCIYRVDVKKSG